MVFAFFIEKNAMGGEESDIFFISSAEEPKMGICVKICVFLSMAENNALYLRYQNDINSNQLMQKYYGKRI